MNALLFILTWVVVGLAVCYVAFFGGLGGAGQRLASRTQTRGFDMLMPLVYVLCGVVIPAWVIASHS